MIITTLYRLKKGLNASCVVMCKNGLDGVNITDDVPHRKKTSENEYVRPKKPFAM